MERNDQVQDGPLTGNSGELKKDSSKEENSAAKPSEKKVEIVPEDATAPSSNSEEKSKKIKTERGYLWRTILRPFTRG